MYIQLDNKNRVTMRAADKFAKDFEVDNKTSFIVENVPEVESGSVLCFDAETKTFYTETIAVTKEQKEQAKAKSDAKKRRDAALKWLSDNDWKVNKHTLGEWSDDDERWLAYLSDREKVRAAIDDAEAVLKGGAL